MVGMFAFGALVGIGFICILEGGKTRYDGETKTISIYDIGDAVVYAWDLLVFGIYKLQERKSKHGRYRKTTRRK